MSTALVLSTSLRLSAAVAMREPELMRLPRVRLNTDIHSLTAMDAASTAMATQLNVTGAGFKIFSTLLFSSSTPMTSTITATARPARYSKRAWP